MNSDKNIENLLGTAMENLRKMANVDTVVGQSINLGEGIKIIPISKVSMGFVAGGGEYGMLEENQDSLPFGGGSGAAMSLNPLGFLVSNGENVKFMPVEGQMPIDKLIDMAPEILQKAQEMFAN